MKKENKEPLISVVMSVYNEIEFLEKSINSILKQTYSNFELIIIDDGSEYNEVRDIIEAFNDNRIRYFQVHHSGVTRCLNLGIGISNGKYIFRQDADDYSDIERFCKQVKYLDEHPTVGMLCSTANTIDVDNNFLGMSEFYPVVNEHLEHANPIIHGSVVFRKTVLIKCGLYNDLFPICQSYDMWLRLSQNTAIHMLKEPLYFFRKYKDSHTAINSKENDIYREIIRNLYNEEHAMHEVNNYYFYEKYSDKILEIKSGGA